MYFIIKIVSIFLLTISFTFAEDEIGVEGFEALFLKIASEAFFSEYEDEKNITYTNRDKIKEIEEKLKVLYKVTKELKDEIKETKELKKQLSSLLSEFSPATLGEIEKIDNIEKENLELQNLKLELKNLKDKIATISKKEIVKSEKVSKKEVKKNQESYEVKKLRLISSSAKVRKTPFINSTAIKLLNRDDIVEIESCDKFGWCKIKKEEAYIEKYLFLEIKN